MAADDPDYTLPPTAEELVAAVLPHYVETIAQRLTYARDRARVSVQCLGGADAGDGRLRVRTRERIVL